MSFDESKPEKSDNVEVPKEGQESDSMSGDSPEGKGCPANNLLESREGSHTETGETEKTTESHQEENVRDGDVRPQVLTEENSSISERKETAREALPERFHSLVDKSEVTKVMSAEQYNDQFRQMENTDTLEQLPAKENGTLNVVEMKLGQDLPVGQVHGMDGSKAYYGAWFAENDASGMSPSEAKEAFVIPPSEQQDYGKTHASYGVIKAGSTVTISEVGCRTYSLDQVDSAESGPVPDADANGPIDALYPPMSAAGPQVRTFQVHLNQDKNGFSNAFQPASTTKLREDQIH